MCVSHGTMAPGCWQRLANNACILRPFHPGLPGAVVRDRGRRSNHNQAPVAQVSQRLGIADHVDATTMQPLFCIPARPCKGNIEASWISEEANGASGVAANGRKDHDIALSALKTIDRCHFDRGQGRRSIPVGQRAGIEIFKTDHCTDRRSL